MTFSIVRIELRYLKLWNRYLNYVHGNNYKIYFSKNFVEVFQSLYIPSTKLLQCVADNDEDDEGREKQIKNNNRLLPEN